MFIDEAEIVVQGGQGGAGKVAFFINKKGPCGGNGGRGGDVYITATPNVRDLNKFTQNTLFKGQDGQQGGGNRRMGINGKDLYLKVPPNTTIFDRNKNNQLTLTDTLPTILICRGGQGGLGNDYFKTSTNRTPRRATPGKKGEEKNVTLVIKLIADVGLIGLPNAGKSSLLNTLTNAQVKTASYPFTTLEPNLGVCDGKVLADIPGLIEGASTGRGLGIKFLKHIEKVTLLLHCISVESINIEKDYQTVIEEIAKYNKTILSKKTIILLTKTDLVSPDEVLSKVKTLKKFHDTILPISIYNSHSLASLRQIL